MTPVGILAARREQRRRQAMTARYLAVLLEEPPEQEVRWLAAASAGGTASGPPKPETTTATVVSELRVLHRVIGLLVAERDALDDQTAADVSHALDQLAAGQSRDSLGGSEQWQAQRREYFDAMASRRVPGAPLARLASVLLRRTGVMSPTGAQSARAVALVTDLRQRANQALQEAYGATSLPDDQLPSDVWRERTGQGKAM